MCQRCNENKQKNQAKVALMQRTIAAKKDLWDFLSVDLIKGSDYINLMNMIQSPDLENLTVVEEVIKQLHAQPELILSN